MSLPRRAGEGRFSSGECALSGAGLGFSAGIVFPGGDSFSRWGGFSQRRKLFVFL